MKDSDTILLEEPKLSLWPISSICPRVLIGSGDDAEAHVPRRRSRAKIASSNILKNAAKTSPSN